MVTISEMYSLEWKQILHKAIQSRETSWGNINTALVEYRNASDCIASQVIQEMKRQGLIDSGTKK